MKNVNPVSASLIVLISAALSAEAATLIDDFSGGVTAVSHPNPADGGTDAFGVYYDIHEAAFADAVASGGALRILDGGFTNGVYAIYEAVIPATGTFALQVDLTFTAVSNSDGDPGVSQYQVGAVVNGVHRGPNTLTPSQIAPLVESNAGTGIATLSVTPGSSAGPTTLTTTPFSASAGDNLLLAFSTDLEPGTGTADFDNFSGFWRDSFVTVDNITLVPEPTVALLALSGFGALTGCRWRDARSSV